MPDDPEIPDVEEAPVAKPAAVNEGVANGGNVVRKDRRATDQPEWFRRWRESEEAKSKPSDEGEDDGILSIEELPDAVEDVIEEGRELVESIPERTHILFGKVFGKKE